ncbi:MAG TPA: proline--tRNA ligase [Thermoplasmata archaeon]|nr:proline--tRNA ligase [Thermoplasmata archaeon]
MPELPDKRTAFIDWYLAVVDAAELTDKRYGVKGMNVWTPYGFLVRRNLDAILIREIERTGSRPVEFPALIPQNEFDKEKEHIKGFDAQVYWVTRGGANTLDVPLVLRPTSETAMYPVFALWIRSHSDLPLNVYQIVNIFRYETKMTRPFLRIREIHFFEEHTCQPDDDGATARVASNLAAFGKMAGALTLPYLAIRRPDWDKFPGARYSIALDVPVGEGRTLQVASIHHYGENFSRPFEITYEDSGGKRRYVSQTTFGLSERLIGTVLAVHGDAKGAVFPSTLAPFQVVVVPIESKGTPRDALAGYAHKMVERLSEHGLRAHLDDRPDRPGAKYYYWECRGVPLRIELGAREMASGGGTAVNRLGAKVTLSAEKLEAQVTSALQAFDSQLAEAGQRLLDGAVTPADKLDELSASTTVRRLSWCGREECGHAIEQAIGGALLGTPEPALAVSTGAPGPCIVCGRKEGAQWAYAGRPI